MQVEGLEVVPYALPFREPYVTARGRLTTRELLLVRLRADGIEGLGETTALSLRGGQPLEQVARELTELCAPALKEAEFDPDRIWSSLARCRNRGAGPQALAAVDVALHELAGRAAGEPVWRLLGAESPRPVTCNATLGVANPSGLRAMLEPWFDAGFQTYKLKVGTPGDVAQVATARQALGADAKIRLDANGAWTVEQAAERLRSLARHTIELVEEPVAGLRGMAEIASRTRI